MLRKYCFYIELRKINKERSIFRDHIFFLLHGLSHKKVLLFSILFITLLKSLTATVIISNILLYARHCDSRSANLLRSCWCTATMIGWSDEIGNGQE